jgi:hypothetical protein
MILQIIAAAAICSTRQYWAFSSSWPKPSIVNVCVPDLQNEYEWKSGFSSWLGESRAMTIRVKAGAQPVAKHEGPGSKILDPNRAPSWGFIRHVESLEPLRATTTSVIVEEIANGLPLRAFYGRTIYESDQPFSTSTGISWSPEQMTHTSVLRAQIVPAWMWSHDHEWPVEILWPGFLLNTLFWSGLFASPFWLRRGFVAWRAARRRRAGLCPICGYARGGINPQHPCPECGRSSLPQPQATPPAAQTR